MYLYTRIHNERMFMKRRNFNISDETDEKLNKLKTDTKISRSGSVELAVDEYFKRKEKEGK